MGTNYYYESCKRSESLHIGKSSAGWVFIFQAHDEPEIMSVSDYLVHFENNPGKIVNEYQQELTVEEFKQLVQSLQSQPNRPRENLQNWSDLEDYHFAKYNFS